MERLLNSHRNSIRLQIKTNSTITIDGVIAPPPHHGGNRAPLLNKVRVKTPPPHHGGDSAPLLLDLLVQSLRSLLLDLLVQSLTPLMCLCHHHGHHGCGHSKIFILYFIYRIFSCHGSVAQWQSKNKTTVQESGKICFVV